MNDGSTLQTCIICGDSIPQARLGAHPSASTCVPCQRRVESRFPHAEEHSKEEGVKDPSPAKPVEVQENRIVAGNWSGTMMEVIGKGGEFRSLLRSGKREEARSLVQAMPNEAQAALVTFDENPEEALSLTGMDGSGKPAYRADVVEYLPSELLATLVAYQTDEKKFNDSLIRAMTPGTFSRTLDETLEPVDNKQQRKAILWEWLEALASVDGHNHRAALLREVNTELLMEALADKMDDLDLSAPFAAGVARHRLFSEDSAVGVLPSLMVDDPKIGAVLDTVYEAAPDVLRALVRAAYEQSGAES